MKWEATWLGIGRSWRFHPSTSSTGPGRWTGGSKSGRWITSRGGSGPRSISPGPGLHWGWLARSATTPPSATPSERFVGSSTRSCTTTTSGRGGRLLLQLASSRASGPGSVAAVASCSGSFRGHPARGGILPAVRGGPCRGDRRTRRVARPTGRRRPWRRATPTAQPRRHQKRSAAVQAAPRGGQRPQGERGDRRRY